MLLTSEPWSCFLSALPRTSLITLLDDFMPKFIPPKYHAVAVDAEDNYLDCDYFGTREDVDDFVVYCTETYDIFARCYVFSLLASAYVERVKIKKA